MQSYADRSRVLTYQSCPRKRYFEYEVPTGAPANGIRPTRVDMNLLVGGCFHKGIEHILEGAKNGFDGEFLEPFIEDGVETAVSSFWDAAKTKGLILEEKEDALYVYHEQAALVEALIRGYAVFCLPQLLERFQVVDVEREEVGVFQHKSYTLHFGARLDGLLMDRSSLELYALSLKTAKEWGKRDDMSARHDMQGLSEVRVVEQRLAKWHKALEDSEYEHGGSSNPGDKIYPMTPNSRVEFRNDADVMELIPAWFVQRYCAGAPPTLAGVKMEYALKGRREEYPKGSGRYAFNNPLIRPWKKADDLGGVVSYAFRYEFKDELGGSHRLGKGWNRVNIWEDMGVKAWIELLRTKSLQGFGPGAAIAGQFILPLEYFRNPEDMDRWERQVVHQEHRITQAKELIVPAEAREAWLDEFFPMHTKSCDWPTKCPFQEICFGPKAYLFDPMSSQIFEPREPNHPTELKVLTK